MQSLIKRITDKLREVPNEYRHPEYNSAIWDAIIYIEECAKKYAQDKGILLPGGWVPIISEKYPDTERYILISFENFSAPVIGRYEEDENGGAFYIGDEDETCSSQDLIVNAWMELPKRYEE